MTARCALLIRNGTVVDGSGADPFVADVAICNDRVVAVGPYAGEADRVIDATGMIVTPGFVDIHTHYDGQAIWSEELSPSSSHGVTTVVTGNCGVGFAPCRPADHDLLIRVMEGVEDIPGVVMAEGLDWDWETFPQYLDALAARPRDIDVGAYLPHSPLRVYVMGQRGADREPATADDLARMRTLTREAMEVGALGTASSRMMYHRTKAGDQIPSYQAADAELQALADGMTDAGSGIIQLVLNAPMESWDNELDHLIGVAERSGRPATFTLGTSNNGPPTWEQAMARVTAANEAGAYIRAQVLPRPVGLIMGFELSTNPFCACASWPAIELLPFAERIARLRDPAIRAALTSEEPDPRNLFAMNARRWEWIFPLGDPPNYEPARAESIAARAAASGQAPEDIAYDLMLERGGHAMLYNALGNFHDNRLDAIHDLMSDPGTVVGLGDGGAHYGAICDASYPTFLLRYWTRDRAGARLSLAQAVRILARDPAEMVGMNDRGLLRPGYKADINVIDIDNLTLHAPQVRYDLPGGGRRIDQSATGFVATIVSGEIIRRHDRPTGARPGRVVRGAQEGPRLPEAVAATT
ncbi:N-acyl-D-aspartate/D-glutamate deacylase [Sphingobium sp. OAS761]|uniref:N-acyl-D-amino-acid deacylase family protein n=1 Tax=Sphingobium sp. OAS761 TaxID=2817901 RepID=UPI00209FDB4D|nr:amidohydrolase family protein [Sphingobium sp. OAS761]MCP1470429.1 N-acyl-D-aspartate/D-glutamate deacylase [Sphingobium sp. OAS761]